MLPRTRRCYLLSCLAILAFSIVSLLARAQTPAICGDNDTPTTGNILPCYDNVPDILNGITRLLQNYDLIVNTATGGINTYSSGTSLLTEDSAISSQITTGITNPNSSPLSNQVTVQGSLWAVDHDQVVPASVNRNAAGQGLVATLENEDSWIGVPASTTLWQRNAVLWRIGRFS